MAHFRSAFLLLVTSLSLPAIGHATAWRNVALEHGLTHKHTQRSEHGISGLHDSMGAGVCAIDIDQDGWQDLFFVGGQGSTRDYGKDSWWNKKEGHRLYRNIGGGHFEDVSDRLNKLPAIDGMGCHAVDLDGDNDTDLVLTGFRESLILKNEEGRFSALPLPTGKTWTTGIAVTDVNGDNLPDLYITGYLAYNHTAKVLEMQSGFKTGELAAFKPASFNGERNFLLLNKGNLQFTESAASFELLEPDTRSLFTTPFNANNDEWPDLFIANDNGSQSVVMLNRQGKGFTLSTDIFPLPRNALSLVLLPDNLPPFGLWFNTMAGQLPVWLKTYQGQWQDRIWRSTHEHNALSNQNSFAAATTDIDHDGEPDLALANGLPTPDEDSHKRSRAQPNTLYLIKQGKLIQSITLPDSQSSRSAIAVDIDNDGDRDVLFTNNNAMPELYVTPGQPGHWLGLDLQGEAAWRTHAITVTTNQRTLQRPWQANAFLASHDLRFTQALHDNEVVERITLQQFGDKTIVIDKPGLNQYLTVAGKPIPSAASNVSLLPYRLARWQLLAGRLSPYQALASARQWSLDEQQAFLQDLAHHDRQHRMLGWVVDASYSAESALVMPVIDLLQDWEDERSANRLIRLLEHPNADVRCRTAQAFRYFYQEEESMVESKRLAMSPLIRNALEGDRCAIEALGFTRDPRPVFALNPLLQGTDDVAVRRAVLQALGELRHHTSTAVIKKALPQLPAILQADARLALNRIAGDIHALSLTSSANQCRAGNSLTILVETCDDAALTTLLQQTPTLASAFRQQWPTLLLHPARKAALYAGLEGANASTLLMQLVNKPDTPPQVCMAALSLLAYLPLPDAYLDLIQQRFADTQLPQAVRLAYGDALAAHRADWLLTHTQGLF